MDFDSWLKTDFGFNSNLESGNSDCRWAAKFMRKAFKAGQQSKQAEIDKRLSDYQLEVSQVGQACVKWKEIAEGKQAEIDALKSKVQELWSELDDRQSKEHIIERCELIIQEILK